MIAKRDVDLSAQLLGLEKTLEDDILDLMESYVKDTADNVIDEIIKDSKHYSDRSKLDEYIKNIVYSILRDIFGDTLIRRDFSGRTFRQQLFYELEKNGFVRDCPTCYFNTQRLGKIKHTDRD